MDWRDITINIAGGICILAVVGLFVSIFGLIWSDSEIWVKLFFTSIVSFVTGIVIIKMHD